MIPLIDYRDDSIDLPDVSDQHFGDDIIEGLQG